MSHYKYASWVKGLYLQLAKEEECSDPNFHESSLHTFFTREESKYKLKTLYAIAQAKSDTNLTSPLLEMKALNILQLLLTQIEDHYPNYGSVRKKELTRALDQFKKATNRLFETLNCTHSFHSFDLIEGAPAMWNSKPISSMNEHEAELSVALKAFWEKNTHRVLLEYADRVESLGTGNPYFLVNNREPTNTQVKIRLAVYVLIAMVGLEAAKNIDNIGAFITHLIIISSPENENLDRSDVSKQINTAIKICEDRGIPITME
jgi:hypothetical protein